MYDVKKGEDVKSLKMEKTAKWKKQSLTLKFKR